MKKRVYLGKGLTRDAAWKKAIAKGGDWRGMSYNAKTGWASLV
jgi:hypothetical protein